MSIDWVHAADRMGINLRPDAPYAGCVQAGIHISAYSWRFDGQALPIMNPGGSIVGMDFRPEPAMPAYNWMTVAKSALESVTGSWRARLASRCASNRRAAGPIRRWR